MRLLLSILLLIIPLSSCFGIQKKQNVVNFSLKSLDKSSTFDSLDILNKNFESITKYVNFNGNSSKLNGRIRLNENLEKIILRLANERIEQNELLVSLGKKNSSYMTVHTDSYRMKIFTSKQIVEKEIILQKSDPNGCQCAHGNCACCAGISVPEFRHSVCVNATYNPVTIGLDLSIGVDGHYFSEEISIRNPPPICFSLPIPGAEHIAGVCVAFTKLDLDRKAKILSGCMDFEVELIHLRVLSFHLGCFRMPI
ncbi:hypothetical protein GCK72_002593 [Caenorhabditis remanei]|uniref:DUF4773 domain-containing protein n=2 Tax=Caenorhabditis remanei TaxID=31234 RepID=A0A6A5HRC6_CAERE|nr:hypothetical protein GCK72_002593 [Caenorhabditis remanei]KAF1770770.1 hypothetical protein GCK72_002593 [Caenorhabditis remanei]